MIATAKPSPESLSIPAWHAGFLEMLPAIRRQARLAFRHLDPEAREEAVEEAVANGNGCRDDQDEGGRNGQPATARQLDYATRLAGQNYHSAVRSLWDNIVNKKYYVTGGVGSGETSEGFGKDYSLPNHAYCESCAGCGALFFQYKMNLIHHDAKYADLYEETLYNAILGSMDLDGNNFCYTSPLDSSGARYPWHVCPCCVGNIPRTLLQLPTWMYTKSADSIYVNLFVGSTVSVGKVAGTDVQMVQVTDYPWSGKVSITVNPSAEKSFAVRIRVPNRSVSELYAGSPDSSGIAFISVNGRAISPPVEKGYAAITRAWKSGDRIGVVLPMKVQRIKASDKLVADAGRVALHRRRWPTTRMPRTARAPSRSPRSAIEVRTPRSWIERSESPKGWFAAYRVAW